MNAVYDALVDLAPLSDPQVLDGYQRYAALVGTLLSPAQLATYADSIRRHRAVRIFEELTPDELAVLTLEEREIAAPDMGHHLGS